MLGYFYLTNYSMICFLIGRVQLGDHDLGPLLDGLKRPSDYVLAGKDSFIFFNCLCTNSKHETLNMENKVNNQIYFFFFFKNT